MLNKTFIRSLQLFIVTCALILLLTSCASQKVTAPNSPQAQILNVTKALHDAVDLAVRTSVQLRDNGTISAADTRAVENWALSLLDLNDSMLKELGSTDTWTIQKQKLLLSLVGFKLPVVTANPILQVTLNSVLSIVQQLQGLTK